jgi:molecular chaperone DnaJ
LFIILDGVKKRMAKRDYYEVLGVGRSANPEDIKKAYRTMAKKYHPDANPGDKTAEEKFKEVNEAYEVLRDEQKRRAYDQFGHAGVGSAARPGGGASAGYAGFSDVEDLFSDIFDGFFGSSGRGTGTRSQGRARRGSDLRYDLVISFLDAAFGKEIQVTIPRSEACDSCHGSGAAPGSKARTCPTCHGSGQVRMAQGFFSVMRTCPTCHGEGTIIEQPCGTCRGEGRVKKNRKITVKVPAGMESGGRLKISGEGEAGSQGGPAGDLYIVVQVAEHPIFQRREDDVVCVLPIPLTTAILGGEVTVPTLTGTVTMKIPPGTQNEKIFRLRGKGIPNLRGFGTGDQLVTVAVEMPSKLSEKQRNALRELEKNMPENAYPTVKEFYERAKQAQV